MREYEECVAGKGWEYCEVGSTLRSADAPSLESFNCVRVEPRGVRSADKAAKGARATAERLGLTAIALDDPSFGPEAHLAFEVPDRGKYWYRTPRSIYVYEGDKINSPSNATPITVDEYVGARAAFFAALPDEYDATEIAEELAVARRIKERWRTQHWGVREGDTLVSVGELYRFVHTAQLESLTTLPAHQRRGYGRAVTTARIRQAQEEGAEVIFAQIDARNLPSRELHESLGFTCIGARSIFVLRDDQ